MPPAAPPFPTFDDWKRMSEREQDAWLDRLEQGKRRGRLARHLVRFGFAAAAAVVVTALVLVGVR
jgi:hypothetical protein